MTGAGDSVSIVLPARDEAGAIAGVVARCRAAVPHALEVLVVDDGSIDGTGDFARAAGARVERLAPARGKGEAVRHGLRVAAGEVVVLLDADGQDDPGDVPLLLAALAPDVSMVIGSRFLGRFEPGAIAPLDRAGTRLLNGAINALWRVALTDTQAGFRAVRRSALDVRALSARGYDIEAEVLLAVLARGGRVVEVPVRRAPRAHGASRLRRFRDGTRILARILADTLRHRAGVDPI